MGSGHSYVSPTCVAHCGLWDAPTWENGVLDSLFLSADTSKVWMKTPQKSRPLSVRDEL